VRRAWIAAIAVAALGASASPAQAEPAVALAAGNTLLRFDTTDPTTTTSVAVTGMGVGLTLRGIDVRPATGELYGQAVATGSANNSVYNTYVIDPATGQATLKGALPAATLPGAADIAGGFDFNPVPDRMRYVNTGDENARFNPNNGALSGDDDDLTPAVSTDVIAAAYDRNVVGGTATTLYLLDRDTSTLSVLGGIDGAPFPGPNGGAVTDLGPLGFNLAVGRDGGFDISPTGVGYAAVTSNATTVTGLYRLTPTVSTTATFLGPIGNGTTEVRGLTILQPDGDGDGVRDFADNCVVAPNSDQADLDADGSGDLCDEDQDGDGLSDAVEIAIGSDPRSANSDGDAVADGADACPTLPGTLANGCPDVILPDTVITAGPKGKTKKRGATFEFISTEPSTTFACSLDDKPFAPCASPRTFKKLRRTKHTFDVRAIDAVNNLDPTPASFSWKVKRKR